MSRRVSAPKILTRRSQRQSEDLMARRHLVDEAMDRYVEWREECLTVDAAYGKWSEAPSDDHVLSFAAYRAALDREESAAKVYGTVLERLERLL
jgi:hypothetical protein